MKFKDLVFPQKLEFDKDSILPTYGKFVAEPFERGYGHTLGNSLRRVLLSSIEGVSITSVLVKNALHEYATIKGIKEDVLEIIMNLKGVRLKLYSPGPEKLYLRVKKEGEVKAKDIEPNSNIEIINPDHLIATLDTGGELEMELEVMRGRGYVPVEKQKREGLPAGTILIDALFSPVSKVRYEVENARVGQITDYDRLIMEIWTDGTVKPGDALTYASKVLKDSLTIFVPEEAEEESEVLEETKQGKDKLQEILDQQIGIIELSVRAGKCLSKAKINTIRELVRKRDEDLLVYRNFGKKSLDEIKDKLQELGLSLGMEV